MGSRRWPLTAFIWVEAWLAIPWLPQYLPLPSPWVGAYVWSKVWGMAMMPAWLTLIALIPDLMPRAAWRLRPATVSLLVLAAGLTWQTLYLLHRVPLHATGSLAARWAAAAMALASLSLSLASPHDNAPPALEILASAALILTFIARPRWADGASLTILAVTIAILRYRRPARG